MKRNEPFPEGPQVWYQVRIRWILWDEFGATNVGEERADHNIVASRVLQASDALNDDANAPREHHVPVRMTTGNIDPVEETIGDLPGDRVVVECKRDLRSIVTRNNLKRTTM